jgi:hypothetical protein
MALIILERQGLTPIPWLVHKLFGFTNIILNFYKYWIHFFKKFNYSISVKSNISTLLVNMYLSENCSEFPEKQQPIFFLNSATDKSYGCLN